MAPVNPLKLNRAVLRSRGKLTTHEKIVLLALIDRADPLGGCWPSHETVAAETGLCERSARIVLARLRARGLVEWTPGGGRSRSNVYRLAADEIGDLAAPVNPAGGAEYSRENPARGAGNPENPACGSENPARGAAETRHVVPTKVHSGSNTEEGTHSVSAEPNRLDADASANDPVLMSFPTGRTGTEWELHESKAVEWQTTWPWLDVLAVCAAARQWLVDNPSKRKTPKGMPRFLGSWCSRDVDGGKHRRQREWKPGDSLQSEAMRQLSIRERDLEIYRDAGKARPLTKGEATDVPF